MSKCIVEKYKKEFHNIQSPKPLRPRAAATAIRTYSKFLYLPAVFFRQGSKSTQPVGSLCDGLTG